MRLLVAPELVLVAGVILESTTGYKMMGELPSVLSRYEMKMIGEQLLELIELEKLGI